MFDNVRDLSRVIAFLVTRSDVSVPVLVFTFCKVD